MWPRQQRRRLRYQPPLTYKLHVFFLEFYSSILNHGVSNFAHFPRGGLNRINPEPANSPLPRLNTPQTRNAIEVSYPLIEKGRLHSYAYTTCMHDLVKHFTNLFPMMTVFEIWLSSPFLVVRLLTLPPKPWSLTIGGLPVRFTTEEHGLCFDQASLEEVCIFLVISRLLNVLQAVRQWR